MSVTLSDLCRIVYLNLLIHPEHPQHARPGSVHMSAITSAHTRTMRRPMYELVRELNLNLGTTLVAYMANVRSRQLPSRWATEPGDPNHSEPRDEAKQRLQLAHQAFTILEDKEDEHVARQWLIGANPRLGGQTPAERIRDFDAPAVFGALTAFVEDIGGA